MISSVTYRRSYLSEELLPGVPGSIIPSPLKDSCAPLPRQLTGAKTRQRPRERESSKHGGLTDETVSLRDRGREMREREHVVEEGNRAPVKDSCISLLVSGITVECRHTPS